MSNSNTTTLKALLNDLFSGLARAFDTTANWVSSLSWWKFFLFSILVLAGGAIFQDAFLNTDEEVSVKKVKTENKSASTTSVKSANTTLEIDSQGIRIPKNSDLTVTQNDTPVRFEIDGDGIKHIDANGDSTTQTKTNNSRSTATTPTTPNTPTTPTTPTTPSTPTTTEASTNLTTHPAIRIGQDSIEIELPKEITEKINAEIEKAIADASHDEIKTYRKRNSQWLMSFIILALFGLFGMKALMGGKVKAEEKAKEANNFAEKEALLRQVSEAQVQLMQAQVEPHFLFNTLASVEYLIETDPPLAAKMQRSLIAYLRAVVPQMRENSKTTNLGREADMVRAYLDLLKMRMEERLEVDFEMPEGLRTASFPPMMLQTVVENAIKHGLEVKAEGGLLQFRAEVAHNKLRVTVSDTGLGFGATPSKGTGLGLQNIRERLKLIYKDQAQIIITPNQPSGVCVTIEVPYELAK
jgi:signal transduction histidine kinase